MLVSPDEQFIGAIGVYPPEMRVFDVNELGMKFARRLDSEIIDFLFLSDDYKKLVLLQEDRTVEFHSQGGRHQKIRVPKAGRALAYFPETAELFIVGSSHEIWRVDLEAGMFAAPLISEHLSEINFCVINPVLPLMCVGGSDGMVEAWDLRDTKLVSAFQACSEDDEESDREVTAAAFSENGMYLAVGTKSGSIRVFDIRAKSCIFERNHRNGLPIKSIQVVTRDSLQFTSENGYGPSSAGEFSIFGNMVFVSTDAKSTKIWCAESRHGSASSLSNRPTKLVASLELDENAAINQASVFGNSGLVFMAGDRGRIGTFFIPALGVAPKWASWLDNFTEELEEKDEQSIFDDLQFVTKQQLVQWGVAESLLGKGVLRPYLHGFFMDSRLYREIKGMIANPLDLEAQRKEKIRAKMDEKKPMRITPKNKNDKKPGVNADLHDKLRKQKDDAEISNPFVSKKGAKQAGDSATNILEDQRFAGLFSNPDFEVELDQDTRELTSFKLPRGDKSKRQRR